MTTERAGTASLFGCHLLLFPTTTITTIATVLSIGNVMNFSNTHNYKIIAGYNHGMFLWTYCTMV